MPVIQGSDKAKYGQVIATVIIDPDGVPANTNIPLPDWARGAQDMVHCLLFRGSDGATTSDFIKKTVIDRGTAPATGEACLWDDNNIRLGDATTGRDMIVTVLVYKSFKISL